MNDNKVIEISNLEKEYKILDRKSGLRGLVQNLFIPKYKTYKAVKGISFDVERGDIVGFIGPNGAGKSTTIKMMSGILAPTSGEIKVCGIDPFAEKKKIANKMGVVFGQRSQLWWDIPIEDSYKLYKTMYKISDYDYVKRINLFNDILGIGDFINKPTRQLSLGQRVRADMCAALLHKPEVLYLDEPTIGLDVIVKEKIRDFILEFNNEFNTSVILTTHDIGDIEKLSKKIVVIDKGNIIYNGDLTSLMAIHGKGTKISFEAQDYNIELLKKEINKCKKIYKTNQLCVVEFDKDIYELPYVLSKILNLGLVRNIQVEETSLENIVKNIYGA